ncbi:MAG: exodeoxyribonuclease VII small subunit [Candidatus Kaelpia imicola]|nr:exodeoxyribonuclease VII small subunit [Candidatus Kaelpia imicola]
MKFDQSLERLEEIAANLEEEDISVEDALKFYEEGVKLVKSCRKKLSEIEKKIELITEDGSGEVKKRAVTEDELLDKDSLGEKD